MADVPYFGQEPISVTTASTVTFGQQAPQPSPTTSMGIADLSPPQSDRIGDAPKMRRNGTQSSCEVCRKAKLRCDHALPCARCVRRGKAHMCNYHPAPMARPKTADSAPGSSASPRSNERASPSHRAVQSPWSEGAINTSAGPPHKRQKSSRGSGSALGSLKPLNPAPLDTINSTAYTRDTPSRLTLGYMGSTGHSAIFLEHRARLGADPYDEPETSPVEDGWSLSDKQGRMAQQKGIKFALAILAWLPSQAVSEQVIEHYFTQTTISCTMTFKRFHKAFWETYGGLLQEPRKPEKVARVAEELCRNTQKPLPIPRTNQEWVDSFCGKKSRWDMMGTLFTVYGSYALLNTANSPLVEVLIGANQDQRRFCLSMLEAADAALMLCDELDISSNVLVVTLLYRCVGLQSIVGGDQNFHLWKRYGELMNTVTAFGLHREVQFNHPVAVLFDEQHRRTFSATFGLSTTLSTFTGRPSCLSWRFVTQNLPTDASEEDLMTKPMSEIQENLNEHGWNTMGKIYPATFNRAFFLLNLIRDEILELALGKPIGNTSERVQQLRHRLETTWHRFPPQLKVNLMNGAVDIRAWSAWMTSTTTVVQLHRLHSSFLLERIEHAARDEQRYLATAKEMLGIVTSFWIDRDKYSQHRDDVHWAISCYGIPSASALAIDLWTASQSAQGQMNPHFYLRADVIQLLSLFGGCLDWVRPTDGNYALCCRAKTMIKQILDRALQPEQRAADVPSSELVGFDLDGISTNDVPAFGQEMEEWFDTGDWMKIPWMEVN